MRRTSSLLWLLTLLVPSFRTPTSSTSLSTSVSHDRTGGGWGRERWSGPGRCYPLGTTTRSTPVSSLVRSDLWTMSLLSYKQHVGYYTLREGLTHILTRTIYDCRWNVRKGKRPTHFTSGISNLLKGPWESTTLLVRWVSSDSRRILHGTLNTVSDMTGYRYEH